MGGDRLVTVDPLLLYTDQSLTFGFAKGRIRSHLGPSLEVYRWGNAVVAV